MSEQQPASDPGKIHNQTSYDPQKTLLTPLLSGNMLEERKLARYELYYIIAGIKELLNNNLPLIDNLIIIDEEGYLVFAEVHEPDLHKVLVPGVLLTIDRAGDNAAGLALEQMIPARLEGYQHYLNIFKKYTSIGIPILKGPRLIGCIGLFIPADRQIQAGLFEFILESFTNATSKLIETRRHLDELFLLKEFFNRLDNTYGMILVSLEDKILQINTDAEALLGIDKNDLIGQSITTCINEEWPLLQKNRGQSLLPVWIRTGHGNVRVMAQLHELRHRQGYLAGYNLQLNSTALHEPVNTKPNYFEFKDIIGQNKEFVKLVKLARAVACSPSNILITGESGTGKELFAQAIHNASNCKDGPFVAVNCAAIPRELIETELFGYEEGAFTGARRGGMKGKFLQASGGTFFLDEVGDMPLELQSKLLRVLQERMVVPLGSNKAIPVDFRLISATNHSLEELIKAGEFRSDLYYRLNVINLHLPPLRERRDDIELLARHFASLYACKLGKESIQISTAAVNSLQNYNWPGNIRELENVMEMAVNLAADYITVDHLGKGVKQTDPLVQVINEKTPPVVSLEEMEKRHITRALIHFQGNISHTANALEIGRTTLYRKIKKYGLFDYVK